MIDHGLGLRQATGDLDGAVKQHFTGLVFITVDLCRDDLRRPVCYCIINGSASLLNISPESLRSKTIEHLLLGRNDLLQEKNTEQKPKN